MRKILKTVIIVTIFYFFLNCNQQAPVASNEIRDTLFVITRDTIVVTNITVIKDTIYSFVVSDDTVYSLARQTFLRLNDLNLTDISFLSNIVALEWLDLSGNTGLVDISPLSKLTKIQNLNLSYCQSITELSALANHLILSELDISNCSGMTDISSISGLNNLTYLKTNNCTNLEDYSPLLSCLSSGDTVSMFNSKIDSATYFQLIGKGVEVVLY